MSILSSFISNPTGIVTGAINQATQIKNTAETAYKNVSNFISNPSEYMSLDRLKKAGLPFGGDASILGSKADAQFLTSEPRDWRVKLSMPQSGAYSSGISFLAPLSRTNGFVFPYTPSIQINHAANYNPLDTVHNNYQFFAYENSKIESISITGDFYVEDSFDAAYWVAAVHYLRSVSKMHYGETSDAGAPPPVVRLTGYGDYVFNNIPVVVTNFNVDLPNDVDYIATNVGNGGPDSGAASASKVSYVPVKSTITVTVQPIYSREQVRKFSLDSFVMGNYVSNGDGYI